MGAVLGSLRGRTKSFISVGKTNNAQPMIEPDAYLEVDRLNWSMTDKWFLTANFTECTCMYTWYFGMGGRYRLVNDDLHGIMTYTPSNDRCSLLLEYIGDRMILYIHGPSETRVREIVLIN